MTYNYEQVGERADLERSLTNITPSPAKIEAIEELREAAKAYAAAIVELCPGGREKSLAKTKLEESVMWAVKAIAIQP